MSAFTHPKNFQETLPGQIIMRCPKNGSITPDTIPCPLLHELISRVPDAPGSNFKGVIGWSLAVSDE
jgi:hypothetical protein